MTTSRPTPSASWNSTATRLRGKHSTLRIHSWLPHFARNGSNGWTHKSRGARIRQRDRHLRYAAYDGGTRDGLETVDPVCTDGHQLGALCHPAGTRIDRVVLRHLRRKQIVRRRWHETCLRDAR